MVAPKFDGKPKESPFFGIRSYIHQFYQEPSQEELAAAGCYLLPSERYFDLYLSIDLALNGTICD